ncbi:tyrosyl-DNA phosphodiesterase 2 isoform X1 [Syngnathus scovelli]|uniref:tyrosyl-DNA phosphodiesterase 2 isoform X1 n=1 Tax=Syngnathus scovelli TaxID=161590 RepID=UPI002110B667|nr:tyrosyl-DNA phosphodiesterase 2 isoform X1 [Syngnathus scovelli]
MASTSDAGDEEERRTRLCEEFAGLTSTDNIVAQCYLAETDWDMERALNRFFDADMEKVFEESFSHQEPPTKNQKVEEAKAPAAVSIDLMADSPGSSPQPLKDIDSGSRLTLISWNVDGLDTENLAERARGLCSYLVLYTPDVVFLQELIPPYVEYLKKRAVSYLIIEGGEGGYFTGMMLKKTSVKLLESQIVPYPTTRMGRNLLMAQVTLRGAKVWLMTSHLESCKEHSGERMKQLREVTRQMQEAPDDVSVLFAGDTNLRDAEVVKVGLPTDVCDVWERLGRQEHCRYTWDTHANSNKNLPYTSRCRFDRVLLRPAAHPRAIRLDPDRMVLVGLEKLSCGRFTSDHWGIYCSLSTTVNHTS